MIEEKIMREIGCKDLEYASLDELIKFQNRIIEESSFLRDAYKSKLYRKKWRKMKVRLSKIQSIRDLNKLPYITDKEIDDLYKKSINKIISHAPQVWFYEKNGKRWVPYSKNDVKVFLRLIDRVFRMTGLDDKDIVLNVAYSAPSLGDMLPYLMAYSQMMKDGEGVKTEIISISLDLLESGVNRLDFTEKRMPTVLLMKPSAALKIREFLKRPPENIKKAIFYGENLEKYRGEITRYYGRIEIFEMYTSIDNITFSLECNEHNGIHLWLDICIPEIIPMSELEREKINPEYKPSATNICNAEEGETGELVLTVFRESLPLIRYRTGNIVKLISNKKCRCGRFHPRIKIIN